MINPVEYPKERILLIESDHETSHLIAVQALEPLGYHVEVAESASSVLQEASKIAPDLIITNLKLPDLSGKDLMVALKSMGIDVPIIVIATKSQKSDILKAFRLGAVDFLMHPIREAEVVRVVENTLKKQSRQDLAIYSQQLSSMKDTLARQAKDFSEIFSISKLFLSRINHPLLFEKIAKVAMTVTGADCAWISASDSKQAKFYLKSCLNSSDAMQSKVNHPYDDGLTSLVAVSGQVVSLHGEALKPFSNSEFIESALAVPMKYKDEVTGIIVVARKTPIPFNASQQAMLELLAEYALIILETLRRFHLVEQRLAHIRQSNQYTTLENDLRSELLRQASHELRSPVKSLVENVDVLLAKDEHRFTREQNLALDGIEEDAEILLDIADSMMMLRRDEPSYELEYVDLNEMVQYVINHYQPIATESQITFNMDLRELPVIVKVNSAQITKVIEGLVSNALKYSPPKGQITLHIEQDEGATTVTVEDQGDGIDARLVESVFDIKSNINGFTAKRYGGIGISLPLIKEIISIHKGRIWIETNQENGFVIKFSLPRT